MNVVGKNILGQILNCNQHSIPNKLISFGFGNITIEVNIKELFSNSESLFTSNIEPKKMHKFEGIILGVAFINLFNYTLFDYEKKQIEFYSDTYNISKNISISSLL